MYDYVMDEPAGRCVTGGMIRQKHYVFYQTKIFRHQMVGSNDSCVVNIFHLSVLQQEHVTYHLMQERMFEPFWYVYAILRAFDRDTLLNGDEDDHLHRPSDNRYVCTDRLMKS